MINLGISILKSDLCDCFDTYIYVEWDITIQADDNRAIEGDNRNLIFKKCPIY